MAEDLWGKFHFRSSPFLQEKILDREVSMMPPDDQRVDGYMWKLKKPLYGLDDASRKFWLKLKNTLVKLGLRVM